jgi:uncharacterized protein YuzE
MKIEFSSHALLKIEIFRSQGVLITKERVEQTVTKPDRVDKGYRSRLVAQGSLDEHMYCELCTRNLQSEYASLPFIREGVRDMRTIKYSRDVDALLIQLSEKKIDYAEEEGQLIIHFSKDNEPVLVEILDAKEFVLNSLSSLIQEKEVAIP